MEESFLSSVFNTHDWCATVPGKRGSTAVVRNAEGVTKYLSIPVLWTSLTGRCGTL